MFSAKNHNSLVALHNAILRGRIVRGASSGIKISDDVLTFVIGRDLGLDERLGAKDGSTTVTRHPFQMYVAASQSGVAAGSTRWTIAPGWVEWRKRFPDATLASDFASGGGQMDSQNCYIYAAYAGESIVLTNSTQYHVYLHLSEIDSSPGDPSFTINAIIDSSTSYPVAACEAYRDQGTPEWTLNIPVAWKTSSNGVQQIATANVIGLFAATAMRYVGSYSSSMIHYPGDVINDGLLRRYVHGNWQGIATLDIEPPDNPWLYLGEEPV